MQVNMAEYPLNRQFAH